MDLPFYRYHKVKDEEVFRYYFYSKLQNKEVLKAVTFAPFYWLNFYNVALVDVLENGQFTDIKTTKDYDRDLILVTVVRIMIDFLKNYSNVKLYFKGNTTAKTRLFRMAISKHSSELTGLLKVYGVWEKEEGLDFEPFNANINYDAFFIAKND